MGGELGERLAFSSGACALPRRRRWLEENWVSGWPPPRAHAPSSSSVVGEELGERLASTLGACAIVVVVGGGVGRGIGVRTRNNNQPGGSASTGGVRRLTVSTILLLTKRPTELGSSWLTPGRSSRYTVLAAAYVYISSKIKQQSTGWFVLFIFGR